MLLADGHENQRKHLKRKRQDVDDGIDDAQVEIDFPAPPLVGDARNRLLTSVRVCLVGVDGNFNPDWSTAASINANSVFKSTDISQTSFILDKPVDFTFSAIC